MLKTDNERAEYRQQLAAHSFDKLFAMVVREFCAIKSNPSPGMVQSFGHLLSGVNSGLATLIDGGEINPDSFMVTMCSAIAGIGAKKALSMDSRVNLIRFLSKCTAALEPKCSDAGRQHNITFQALESNFGFLVTDAATQTPHLRANIYQSLTLAA